MEGAITITDEEILNRDWRESEQMVLVCKRKDGSIAKHMWNVDENAACVLALEAFAFNIRPLFKPTGSVTTTTYKRKKTNT